MDIEHFIEAVFKIEFLKIKCINFKKKKKEMEKVLKSFPEIRSKNFNSNRDRADIRVPLKNIFADEFNLIKNIYPPATNLTNAWSVTYKKGDYHLPHTHGSVGYGGILYLNQHKKHPRTTYLQPWNSPRDNSVLFNPEVEEGDIMIVPKFIVHHTEPNKLSMSKRIIGFDF